MTPVRWAAAIAIGLALATATGLVATSLFSEQTCKEIAVLDGVTVDRPAGDARPLRLCVLDACSAVSTGMLAWGGALPGGSAVVVTVLDDAGAVVGRGELPLRSTRDRQACQTSRHAAGILGADGVVRAAA